MAKGQIINISGTSPVDDPEYRYKMPKVVGKLEGRGNGSKTVIVNISELALSLHRDPGEVNKFFGTELGAQTTYSDETNRAVVNGHHTDAVLQQAVHKYVEAFVICPNCGLPETDYKIKSGVITHKCAACGAKEMVDMSHKLTNYIWHRIRRRSRMPRRMRRKIRRRTKRRIREKKDKKSKDKKKEKKEKKKKSKDKDGELEDAVGDISLGDDDVEHVDDDNAMATKKFLSEIPMPLLPLFLTKWPTSKWLRPQDPHLCPCRLTTDFFKTKQVAKNAPSISKITQGKTVMERHLISACECLCADEPKKFAVLLKQLYDEDILEEILSWNGLEREGLITLLIVSTKSRGLP
ncbi:eukaryotic translation initiation factor 5 [Skeletonema marinoi]|uniref:Eukaryotic translation initiation factor 5 n=1 Tax=Skeletonema marinoi TaxID=267567 RepID=A0AAD8YE36_9STRA|nr:eukaryotic translation initiation factor 5 [Skeletonema marinoi]